MQYKSLQLDAFQKYKIKSQLKLSTLMLLDIKMEFFPDTTKMENQTMAEDGFYTKEFL